ncbi:hypothetical protein D3C85_1355990 [compost metagenome]
MYRCNTRRCLLGHHHAARPEVGQEWQRQGWRVDGHRLAGREVSAGRPSLRQAHARTLPRAFMLMAQDVVLSGWQTNGLALAIARSHREYALMKMASQRGQSGAVNIADPLLRHVAHHRGHKIHRRPRPARRHGLVSQGVGNALPADTLHVAHADGFILGREVEEHATAIVTFGKGNVFALQRGLALLSIPTQPTDAGRA